MQKSNHSLLIKSLDIPYFETLDDFSKIIGLSSKLLYCLSNFPENYYSIKKIPKRSGKLRTIYVPSFTLKIVQKWILVKILNKLKPSEYAIAFRKNLPGQPKYDIKKNAFFHADSLYGLSIDLKNFFPSIKANKVFWIFRNIGYNYFAATILTNLCTFNGELPQGAVCSPALSNLICANLDKRLEGLCAKRGILYTRYADDLYFSCDNKILLLRFYPVIQRIIEDEAFEINLDKLHFHTPTNKKSITGITVVRDKNKIQLKAPKKLKHKVRAEIFRCIMSGSYNNLSHIKGEISYINFIENENDFNYIESITEYILKLSDKITLYPELVEAYNSNLIFKNLPKIEHKSINVFTLMENKIEKNFSLRKKYLQKNNIVDICDYSKWPKSILDSLQKSIDEI